MTDNTEHWFYRLGDGETLAINTPSQDPAQLSGDVLATGWNESKRPPFARFAKSATNHMAPKVAAKVIAHARAILGLDAPDAQLQLFE